MARNKKIGIALNSAKKGRLVKIRIGRVRSYPKPKKENKGKIIYTLGGIPIVEKTYTRWFSTSKGKLKELKKRNDFIPNEFKGKVIMKNEPSFKPFKYPKIKKKENKGGTLTLKEMKKLYLQAKEDERINNQCEICKRKVKYFYYYEGDIIGRVCEDHKIKKIKK